MVRCKLHIFLFLILMATPACAQEMDSFEGSTDEVFYELTLDQVSRLALINNFDIQLAKYDTWIARTGGDRAESIYDTLLKAQVAYNKDESARTNTFSGTKNLSNDYDINAQKKLPTGTTLSIDVNHNRSWNDSAFSTINPSHDTSLGFKVEQELGQNYFGMQDRGAVKLARLDVTFANFTSLNKIEQELAEVQKAYWDLVLQVEKVEVQREMVGQAKKLWDINQEKLKTGLAEDPDVFASEANYLSMVNQMLLVEKDLRSKSDILRLQLNVPNPNVVIVPKEKMTVAPFLQAKELSLESAYESRSDYQLARRQLEAKDINLVLKKQSLWPVINLSASLVNNGVSANYKEAYSDMTNKDNPNFSTSLSVAYPLENTAARSDLTAARLAKAKTIVSLKQLERKIAIEVIDQMRTCKVLSESAANAVQIAELQKKKLEAELKRYRSGRSNTDTIIRFQDDVVLSKLSSVQAKFAYLSSLIDMKMKEGQLLKMYWKGNL